MGPGAQHVRVAVDVRIYDTETGVVVASENVSAAKVNSSRDLAVNVSFFRWDDQESQNSTLGFVTRELVRRGHTLSETIGRYGGYQAIARDPSSGVYSGASESRKDGCAAGY